MKKTFAILILFVFAIAEPSFLAADEGMWLFENPPKQQVKEKYGFDLTDDWLDHVRLSSIRFARMGSASFVSSQGLILTNHHVGLRCLQELSTPENNLRENGFYAKTFEEELPYKGGEIIVTAKMEDVTEKVAAAVAEKSAERVAEKTPDDELGSVRSAVMAEIEQKAAEESGLRCEIITLYQGGKYHLYYYKVYDDIRLVWAPEESIGAFGGDPDNYEYPRFCLDACLFRAYENGKPAKIDHFLGWCKDGLKDGELTFVSGFPGKTDRAYTREHLEFQRDVYFPWRLQKLFRREVVYTAFGQRSLENQRRVDYDLRVVQNYRKRAIGQLDGLQTPSLWDGKTTVEGKADDSPEARIAKACEKARDLFIAYDQIEKGDFMKTSGDAFHCRTFQIAKTLVRMAFETQKPNNERLPEFRDGSLEALKASLFADTPIHEDVEILKLTDSLTMLHEISTATLWDDGKNIWNDMVKDGFLPKDKSPKEIAVQWIRGSKVRNVAERKRLVEGGSKAIEKSDDPIIRFLLKFDVWARIIQKHYTDSVTNPMTEAYAELAKKRFEELGTSVYPDATFTLRLSYGAVKGYLDDNGEDVAPFTDIAEMYQRAEAMKNRDPFDPPQRWKDAKEKLDLGTKFNFVSTNDIIGGNSGSPVINAKKEVVGLAFDGNIYSLSNNFVYTEKQSRCVSVHADVIVEALKKIYNADRIVEELGK